MRFSSFLVSLAILLSISSVSAQTLMSATWSNPYTTKDVSSYCCIPTSVDIYCSTSSSCTATYKYTNSVGSKCWNLFLSSTSKLSLYKSGSTYSTETFYSETTFFGKMNFNFVASNTTGSPMLNIYSTSSSYYDGCDFTMQSRNCKYVYWWFNLIIILAPGTTNSIGGVVIFIIIFFIVVASAGASKRISLISFFNFFRTIPKETSQCHYRSKPCSTTHRHCPWLQLQYSSYRCASSSTSSYLHCSCPIPQRSSEYELWCKYCSIPQRPSEHELWSK